MDKPTLALVLVWCVAVAAQCPEFDTEPLPKCDHRSDHELCVLAAHKDSDRLADFEFMNLLEIKTADPLACKLRAAAIRQHVIFHGEHGHGSSNCKRAAAIFKTNSLTNTRISDVCEQIGFAKCAAHCHHGGKTITKEDGSCVCECSTGWTGKTCSECAMMPMECLNNGTLIKSSTQCECACEYPWSGIHCDSCNRNCKNGGFSNPTDPKCQCQCDFPWSGVECNECDLQCQHGGRFVHTENQCACECSPLAEGPQCEQCSARCLNGGVLDKETCTCKCVGGFTGLQCEICDVKCMYNGTFIPNECACKCNNPWTAGDRCQICKNVCHGRGREVDCTCVDCEGYWTGSSCNNCTLRCVNEGELDQRSCKCACDKSRCRHGQAKDDCSCECEGFWRGETCDQCHLNCRHGTLNPTNCSCACEDSWSGPHCDICEKNCTGRGFLDARKCMCTNCLSPYHGFDCREKCNKNCQHGSQMHVESCKCLRCPLPWLGDECNICKLTLNHTASAVCKHGVFDPENCRCQCEEGWSGERCEKCSRVCAHGTLNTTDCSCSCQSHWSGVNCTDCLLECQNGGSLDRQNCYCECDHLHSGTYCQGGPCHMQQACDSCLSISDGCEWCGKTSQCSKKPGPGSATSCVGPVKYGLCPTYGECHMCDYTQEELWWLQQNGEESVGRQLNQNMPEPSESVPVCNAEKKETWCALKRMCVQDWVGGVNGPCQPMEASEKPRALNGFIIH
eukprot:c1868_g1_i1.p1 GENE.c1868_g1_i1~~c1868_g1_i1.p1  ORF type:complete len:734 (-),score=99.37 c1868_g1_i1:78-2279(-)